MIPSFNGASFIVGVILLLGLPQLSLAKEGREKKRHQLLRVRRRQLLGLNSDDANQFRPFDMNENRIVNGQVVRFKAYPFYVSLKGCGGVLVAKDVTWCRCLCRTTRERQLDRRANRELEAVNEQDECFDSKELTLLFILISSCANGSSLRICARQYGSHRGRSQRQCQSRECTVAWSEIRLPQASKLRPGNVQQRSCPVQNFQGDKISHQTNQAQP